MLPLIRSFIDHSQTSSLRDIMALLPGASVTNPDLSSAHSISLRSVNGSDMNSLGTAIIVDGAPMSNNANMEGITAAMNGVSSQIAELSERLGLLLCDSVSGVSLEDFTETDDINW